MHTKSKYPHNLTSSQTGTFYFAYGSNLSPEQMTGRCLDSPTTSSTPVAIARLDGWRWIICQRGYANIVPSLPPAQSLASQALQDSNSGLSHGQQQQQRWRQKSLQVFDVEDAKDDNVVWGIIYNLTPMDESILDEYEGHDPRRNPTPTPNRSLDPSEVRRNPFEQGGWDYNKLYLSVTVTRWLEPPQLYGVDLDPLAIAGTEPRQCERSEGEVTVLVYVDELRTEEGPVQPSYVGRMNRAIGQGVELGVPEGWVERVMRRRIERGVGVDKGFLGRRDGYWDGEGEEAEAEVRSVDGNGNGTERGTE